MLCRVPCFNALNGYFYVSGGSSHCSNFVTQPLSLLKSYISYLRQSYLLYCGRFEAASLGCMVYRRNFCSCEKEAWKNSGLYIREGFEPLTSAIPCRDQEFKSPTSLNFFRLSFGNCKSCVYKCDDLFSYNYIYFIRLNTISVFSGIPILMCLRFLSNTIKTVT